MGRAARSAAAADAGQAGAPRKAWQVLGHLHVDGTDYAPSRDQLVSVELTEDEAKDLLASGVIGEMPPAED